MINQNVLKLLSDLYDYELKDEKLIIYWELDENKKTKLQFIGKEIKLPKK